MNATNSNSTWLLCNFNDTSTTNTGGYWLASTGNSYPISGIDAQSKLGLGMISKLAQKADDLGLNPKCYYKDEVGYLTVRSYNTKLVKKLVTYAKRIGFKIGPVEVRGGICPCYL